MKKTVKIVLLILFVFGISSCATNTNVTLTKAVESDIMKKILEKKLLNKSEKNDNTIKGSAFLVNQIGDGKITCAGQKVLLFPKTNYSNEQILVLYGNNSQGYVDSNLSLEKIKFSRKSSKISKRETICDSQGFFSFNNVPSGSFFVMTTIEWKLGDFDYQGGALMKQVNVRDNEIKEVLLVP